jgi:hypothetical protein
MPWFMAAVLLVILCLALIEDGMLQFAAHRRAELLAESAARAGASQLDKVAARGDPTAPPEIDVVAADQAARMYVLQQQPDATVDVSADPETIVVTVALPVPPTILHPPGQPTVVISADGRAHPFVGQATAEP